MKLNEASPPDLRLDRLLLSSLLCGKHQVVPGVKVWQGHKDIIAIAQIWILQFSVLYRMVFGFRSNLKPFFPLLTHQLISKTSVRTPFCSKLPHTFLLLWFLSCSCSNCTVDDSVLTQELPVLTQLLLQALICWCPDCFCATVIWWKLQFHRFIFSGCLLLIILIMWVVLSSRNYKAQYQTNLQYWADPIFSTRCLTIKSDRFLFKSC